MVLALAPSSGPFEGTRAREHNGLRSSLESMRQLKVDSPKSNQYQYQLKINYFMRTGSVNPLGGGVKAEWRLQCKPLCLNKR
jgi:hypothetical protein